MNPQILTSLNTGKFQEIYENFFCNIFVANLKSFLKLASMWKSYKMGDKWSYLIFVVMDSTIIVKMFV